MRSLYSGVSGLRVHQTRMDVIGANLANVNTVGFKASRVTFRDVLYQTVANPTIPRDADAPVKGGTNPSQIGLGVMVGTIDVLNTRAGPMLTDKPTDLYIDGEGYFMVRTGALDDENAINYYTRVGDFRFDALGRLVDGNGNYVMGKLGNDLGDLIDTTSGIDFEELEIMDLAGFLGDIDQWARLTQIGIGLDGIITAYDPGVDPGDDPIIILGQIAMCKFTNAEGLSQEGNSYFIPTRNTGAEGYNPTVFAPGSNGLGRTVANRLEMSNVELSKEFTDMIVTQRGFQANSRIITVSDEMLQELVNLKR